MQKLLTVFKSEVNWNAEALEVTFKNFLETNELGMGAVLPNFRLLVTGKGMGPSMFAIAEILGKEETLSRIENGISKIEALKAEA